MCNLELSKRLKELGVKQYTAFYWTVPKNDTTEIRAFLEAYSVEQNWLDGMIKKIAAFTVAELGEMLPAGYLTWWYAKQDGQGTTLWRCSASVYDNEPITKESNTEADARAKMLIYLLENKLITLQ